MPPQAPQETESLLARTVKLMRADSRRIADIERASGLNYFWLRKMRQGSIKNPSVNTVEALHAFLSK